MTIPETVNLPLVAIVVVFLIGVLLLLVRGGRSSGRGLADRLAAAQAERDVLRANHAVEIATLEHKLAEARSRAPGRLQAGPGAGQSEQRLAEAALRADRLAAEVETLNGTLSRLSRERDEAVAHAADVPRLLAERDRAQGELAELREQLVGAGTTDERGAAAALAELRAERDRMVDLAERHEATIAGLKREIQSLVAKLSETASGAAADGTLAEELSALREREAELQRTLDERDSTIAELREAGADGDEIAELKARLAAAEARERAANESLSSLAYDRDGLQNRVAAAERTAGEARAQLEKKETLLELRLQKIQQLEGRVRESHRRMQEVMRRAEPTEAAEGAPGGGAAQADAQTAARLGELEATVAGLREENHALRARRNGADPAPSQEPGELAELRAAVDMLARENTALREQQATLEADGVEALKVSLRTLAQRFVEHAEAEAPEPAEPTLAERIRAFKAARAAQAAQSAEAAEAADPGKPPA